MPHRIDYIQQTITVIIMQKILSTLSVFALLLLGCSENGEKNNPGGLASMQITLQGDTPDANPNSRAVGPSTPNPAVEGVVSNFTVFVFSYTSGDLEKSEQFTITGDNYSAQITDLSTGTEKRVVVYVNVPENLDLSNIKTYGDLRQNILTLDSQYAADIAKVGLFMSGETTDPLSLQASAQNNVTINVKRRVAKVVLRSLKVTPAADAQLSEFALTGVSIQKARLSATPLGAILADAGTPAENYAGGLASPDGATPNFNLTRTYLNETISAPTITPGTDIIASADEQRYFYVLSNDNTNNDATLMTIYGTYGLTPQPAYYPFVINGSANGTGGNSTDGNYIQCNKIYMLDVTLTRINLPSDDPNVVPSQVVLNVTIVPQDWDVTLNQVVEW